MSRYHNKNKTDRLLGDHLYQYSSALLKVFQPTMNLVCMQTISVEMTLGSAKETCYYVYLDFVMRQNEKKNFCIKQKFIIFFVFFSWQ